MSLLPGLLVAIPAAVWTSLALSRPGRSALGSVPDGRRNRAQPHPARAHPPHGARRRAARVPPRGAPAVRLPAARRRRRRGLGSELSRRGGQLSPRCRRHLRATLPRKGGCAMIELVAGDAKLLVCPDIGGAIGGWTRRGTAIFRATSDEALAGTNSRLLSCFPFDPVLQPHRLGPVQLRWRELPVGQELRRPPPHHPRQTPGSVRGTWSASPPPKPNWCWTMTRRTTRPRPAAAATGPTATPRTCSTPCTPMG